MEDKNKLIAAFEHIRQASVLLSTYNIEISKTLKELNQWIVENYSITDKDIQHMDDIIAELMNG